MSELPPAHPPVAPARSHPIRNRLIALLLFLGSGAVLGFAIYLRPSPQGYGTHQQLGFAPCGTLLMTGLPCPTCGMTTSFSNTVRGRVFAALWAQPGGFVLALGTIATFLLSAWALARGRLPRAVARRLEGSTIFTVLLFVLLGGWAVKLLIGFMDGTLPLKWY